MRRARARRRRALAAGLLGLSLGIGAPALGQAPGLPPVQERLVEDRAGVLGTVAEARLRRQLRTIREDPGIEMAVLTLRRRHAWDPQSSLEAFATAVFDDRGIGDATRDDGILLLLSLAEREARIELGAGYGRDWDGVATAIMEKTVLPALRAGAYGRGLSDGTARLAEEIARPFRAGKAPARARGTRDALLAALPFALIVGMILWRVLPGRSGPLLARLRRCPGCGRRGLTRSSVVDRPATELSRGSARDITRCPRCGHEEVQPVTLPSLAERREALRRRRTDGGHGGSSGGGSSGGGSSGGGGASGRF